MGEGREFDGDTAIVYLLVMTARAFSFRTEG